MPTLNFIIESGSNISNWGAWSNEPKLSGILLPVMTGRKLTIDIRKPVFPSEIYEATKPDGTPLEVAASATNNLAYTADLLSVLACFSDCEIRFKSDANEAKKRVILLVQQ